MYCGSVPSHCHSFERRWKLQEVEKVAHWGHPLKRDTLSLPLSDSPSPALSYKVSKSARLHPWCHGLPDCGPETAETTTNGTSETMSLTYISFVRFPYIVVQAAQDSPNSISWVLGLDMLRSFPLLSCFPKQWSLLRWRTLTVNNWMTRTFSKAILFLGN